MARAKGRRCAEACHEELESHSGGAPGSGGGALDKELSDYYITSIKLLIDHVLIRLPVSPREVLINTCTPKQPTD